MHVCRACDFANPQGMSFCGRCGTPLAVVSGPRGLSSQERRRLTVLFCDLVGSTALSECMEMEDYEYLLRRYQEGCTAIVRSHDGFVARYVGDALLVLFGYPQALEDAPAQAVRAALAMVAAVATLEGGTSAGEDCAVAVRIGIATGDVVVGDLVGNNMVERAAVRGIAPNLAARLQMDAEPNAIVISEETRRRLPDNFAVTDLGVRAIRGLQRPERAFRVIAERQAALSGLSARFRGGATVGRDLEHARLHRHWEQARTGRSLVVAVRGDPGIGKSRLVRDFCDRIKADRKRSVVLSCSPIRRDSAFYPIATEMRRLLRLGWGAPPAAVLRRLETLVDAAGLPRAEAVPLLADLLSIDAGSGYPRLVLTPPRRRERLLDVFAVLLRHWLGKRPLLVIAEDVQWADPSMGETISGLLRRLNGVPYLCVFTHRTGTEVGWLDALSPEIIEPARLDQACSAGLALAVTGASGLPPPLLLGIVERAEGVPLFIEELTKNAVEGATGAIVDPRALPASLHESLVARLDRMPDGKVVAQVAAVIGRRFSLSLLTRIAPMSQAQLAAGLAQLVVAGLVAAEQGEQDDGYFFHHALLRDAAYNTLLMRVRRRLHHDVATVLVRHAESGDAPELIAEGHEIVAQHLTLAEDWEPAVAAWLAAGQRAYGRLDLAEATSHFRHGLGLLAHLPDAPVSRGQELALHAGHGAACMLLRGYAAPEVDVAFTRAYELSGDILDAAVFPILWGVWAFQVSAGRERFGEAAANRMSVIAKTLDDRALRVLAHAAQAATRGALGELSRSESEARAAVALYDPVVDHGLARAYTMDPKALSMLFLRHVLWIQGRPAEAEAVAIECMAFARDLGHPFVVPYVLIWGGATLVYAGRNDEAISSMIEGVTLARAGRLDLWSLTGELWRGAALIGKGELADGVALLEQQLSIYEVTGVRLAVPYLKAILAAALPHVGRIDDAVALINEAVGECDEDGLQAAEIRRLNGDILLALDLDAAAACYRSAIVIARRQGALAWEGRAKAALAALERRGSLT